MVACSPGWPAKRVWGSITNFTPAAVRRSASASQAASPDHAEVGHRHVVAVDGVVRAPVARRPAQMGDDLMAVEVEVDPVVALRPSGQPSRPP